MAYSNAEIYDRNKSEAEREQKLLSKLKRISAKGNNAEVKQDRDGNWIVYEVKKQRLLSEVADDRAKRSLSNLMRVHQIIQAFCMLRFIYGLF